MLEANGSRDENLSCLRKLSLGDQGLSVDPL